jgi:hypothetical protein
MSKKILLIIGTIILISSTIVNTTIEFYLVNKIGGLSSEAENENRLIVLLFQAEMRGVLEYELADNLCMQNISFRMLKPRKDALKHFANFQGTINKKLASSIIDLKAAINYNRSTAPGEIKELNNISNQGSLGYLKLTKVYYQLRDSLTDARRKLVDKRDAITTNIKHWDDIRSKLLLLSVFLQVVALICFTSKDLRKDK